MNPAEPRPAPSHVFLFSGHLVDRPERPTERFPANQANTAAVAIEELLEHLNATPGDLAICGGACGGDLLFAKAALDRGLDVEMQLTFSAARFLGGSVAFAGQQWIDLFHLVCAHRRTTVIEPDADAEPAEENLDAYTGTNGRMLERALSWGSSRVRFVCLWNGDQGGGSTVTGDMVERAQQTGAEIHILDTNHLW